jgi:NADPH:quinone reductase-like Zn-dependent oxidoreductase
MMRQGTARPLVAATLPLVRAADAHRLLEESAPAGRIVLVPGSQAT